MSVTTDNQPGRGIEAALSVDGDPADALFREVRRLLTEEGFTTEQVLEALAGFRERSQRAGDDEVEDAIVEGMNVLSHWANPQVVDAVRRPNA